MRSPVKSPPGQFGDARFGLGDDLADFQWDMGHAQSIFHRDS